jgi:zinc protease
MKKIFSRIFLASALTAAPLTQALALDVVELRQPRASKVVVELQFRNGSAADPVGKEGLTFLTSQLVTEGGTKAMTAAQIKDFVYPLAASYYARTDKEGLTFLTSQLVTEGGTKAMTAAQIKDFVYPLAASYYARTDKEVTTFTFEFHHDHLEKFYPVLTGLMLTPTFTEEDFQRLKSNQLNYVEQVVRASSDEDYSKFALEDQLFRGTRYQHLTRGTAAGLRSITLDDVKKFYAAAFGADNLTIGIAGNYSPAYLAKLKADFARLPAATTARPAVPTVANPNGVRVEIISQPNALGSAVYAGFPLSITRSNLADFAALMVANSYLGEHRKSYGRLYDKIRTTRSMNYGDYSYIEWYEAGGQNMLPLPGVPRHANYTSIWLRPVQIAEGLRKQYPTEMGDLKVGQGAFALRLAVREMENMVKNGLSAEDFDLTRTFLRSYTKLYAGTPARQLGFLLDSKFYGLNDYLGQLDAQLAKLTRDDVNQALKKHWQTQNMYVTIVTDDSEAQPLAEVLRQNTPVPMSYTKAVRDGLPAPVLAEDEQVTSYKLNVTDVKVIDTKDTFR